jgi:putative protease
MIELVSPAGSFDRFLTALHYGADAVYIGGKEFSLRAFSENFTLAQMKEAIVIARSKNKKIYAALNIFAANDDFKTLPKYIEKLAKIGVDAVIASDLGIIKLAQKIAPELSIHLSTQANTTNLYSAIAYAQMGIKRIVLARELSLKEIAAIRTGLDKDFKDVRLEAFVHGAMCVSYSGRCLLSNYLSDRASNRGECVQPCRWEYYISEVNRAEQKFEVQQDGRGTYILNSKDLNMLPYIDKLYEAGVTAFKIEGRAKSSYYLATVTNAYRRAIDGFYKTAPKFKIDKNLLEEPYKASNRSFTTGFYFGDTDRQNLSGSSPVSEYEFLAEVIGYDDGKGAILVEQRNRFLAGDTVEILSNGVNFNKRFKIEKMFDTDGAELTDAKNVQQKIYIKSDIALAQKDILRRAK